MGFYKRRYVGSVLSGLFLVALGVAFLLQNFGITHIPWTRIWPLWMIAWGVMMLIGALSCRHRDYDRSGRRD